MRVLKLAVSLSAVSALLSGCFATTTPVFDGGDSIPIAGGITCKEQMGRAIRYDLLKSGSGFGPWQKVVYKDAASGKQLIYRHLKDSLYLAQESDSSGRSSYSYIDFTSRESPTVLVANVMANNRAFDATIKTNNLRTGGGPGSGLVYLGGDAAKIAAFLENIDASQLIPVASCRSGA